MLVISRKIGERIVIEGGIIIQILDVDAITNVTKIGIVAPKNVQITKEEIDLNSRSEHRTRYSSLAPFI